MRDTVLKDIKEEDIQKKPDSDKPKQNSKPGGGKFTYLQPKPPPHISQK